MPGVMAAAKVAGKSTGRAKSAAGASATAKALPADLPRDPGAHVAKLRGQGQDDAQIRKVLQDMGYPAATANNVAPGSARTGPAAAPATETTPTPDDPTSSAPAATPAARSSRAPSSARSLPSPGSGDGTISGFLLGLVGTAVLINFMNGGPTQVRQWAGAKFLNNVGPPATPGSSGKPALPGTGAPRPLDRYRKPGSGAGGGGGGSW